MPSRDLTYNLIGKDVSASSVFSSTADAGEKMSSRIGTAISGLGDKIGGELGGVLDTVGAGFTKIGDAGDQLSAKLAAVSGGALALGFALSSMGSKDESAQNQLKAAIEDTGGSWSDYSGQIDSTISKMENFGHSASDTQNALTALTVATQDPTEALNDMGVAANLAAVKHESLTDAATSLAKVAGGSGSKILRQYGVDMTVTAGNTQEANAAIQALGDRLQGQASASVDSFSGRLDVLKTKLLDDANVLGEKIGPALQVAASGALLASTGVTLLAARSANAVEAEVALSAASSGASIAETKQVITSQTLAASLDELRLAEINAAIANDALSAALEGAAVAEGELAVAADAADVSMLASLGPVGVFIGALAAVGAALDPIAHDIGGWVDGNTAALGTLKNLLPAMSTLGDAIHEDGDAYGNMTKAALVADIANSGLMKTLQGSKITLADLVSDLGDSDSAWNKQIQTWKNAGQINSYQAVALTAVKGELDNQTLSTKAADAAIAKLGITTDGAATADANLSNAVSTTSSEFEEGADRVAQYKNVIATMSDNNITAATDQDNFQLSLDNFNQTINGDTTPAVKQATDVVTAFNTAITELSTDTTTAAQDQDSFQLSLNGLSASLATAFSSTVNHTMSMAGNTTEAINNRDAVLSQIQAMNQVAQAQSTAGLSTAMVTKNLAANEKALEDAAVAAGLNKAQVAALIAQYAVNPSAIGPKMAADAAKTATDNLSTSTSTFTDKTTQNRDAVLSAIQAIDGIANAQLAAGEPISEVNANLGKNEQQLYKVATQAGMTKSSVKALIDQYGLIPTSIETNLIFNDENELAAINGVIGQLNYLAGLETTDPEAYAALIGSFNQFTLASVKEGYGNATGGMLNHAAAGASLNGFTKVGEYGPELVGPDGRVYPTGQSSQMMRGAASGSSNITYQIQVHVPTVTQPTPETMRAVVSALEMHFGQGGQLHLGRGSIVSRTGRIG